MNFIKVEDTGAKYVMGTIQRGGTTKILVRCKLGQELGTIRILGK